MSCDPWFEMSMDSHLGGMPAVPKYSKELQTAVQDDKRRQEIDSAKKCAAAQNVDYESFAALVSMAHVKPFERKRCQQKESAKHIRSLPAWSFDASGSLFPLGGSLSAFSESSLLSKTGNSSMKTEEENHSLAMRKLSLASKAKCITADCFKREWRRLGTNFQKKLAFLLAFSPDELPNIFKVELPPSILSDVIEVLCWWKDSLAQGRANALVLLNSNSDAEGMRTSTMGDVGVGEDSPILQSFDAHLAFQMLKSLCACGRFSLSLKLAGTRVSYLANQLINKLVECMEKNDISSRRVNSVASGGEHDATVGYMTEDSKDSGTDSSKGQTLSLDELQHLASVYT